jgi:hypothetical protein
MIFFTDVRIKVDKKSSELLDPPESSSEISLLMRSEGGIFFMWRSLLNFLILLLNKKKLKGAAPFSISFLQEIYYITRF